SMHLTRASIDLNRAYIDLNSSSTRVTRSSIDLNRACTRVTRTSIDQEPHMDVRDAGHGRPYAAAGHPQLRRRG
ncbi:MAG TPA: hypothetical protein PK144_02420, partial [Plasticicumulans sp.]|nr:hypothetical protein [Plasticicumulans sp.]